MIVFDGDSVLAPGIHGATPDQVWPGMVSQRLGIPHVNLAKSETTAEKSFIRVWKVLEHKPQWYVLQIGQWSSSQEPLGRFEKYLREIIEIMNLAHINVMLVSPPPTVLTYKFNTHPYTKILNRMADIYRVSMLNLPMQPRGTEGITWMFAKDDALCHFSEEGHRWVAELFMKAFK